MQINSLVAVPRYSATAVNLRTLSRALRLRCMRGFLAEVKVKAVKGVVSWVSGFRQGSELGLGFCP